MGVYEAQRPLASLTGRLFIDPRRTRRFEKAPLGMRAQRAVAKSNSE